MEVHKIKMIKLTPPQENMDIIATIVDEKQAKTIQLSIISNKIH